LLSFSFLSFSQDSIFQWKVSSKKIGSNQFEVIFTTEGNPNWQLYAPNQSFSNVPNTEIQFDSAVLFNNRFETSGKNKTEQSAIFGEPVHYNEGPTTWKAVITIPGKIPAILQDTMLYTYGRGEEFYPATAVPFSVNLEGGVESGSRIKIASVDIKKPVMPCGDEDAADKSLFGIFLLGFLGGLIALITPCVFPLIPLTVSFFTKKSGTRQKGVRNALLYGLSIF